MLTACVGTKRRRDCDADAASGYSDDTAGRRTGIVVVWPPRKCYKPVPRAAPILLSDDEVQAAYQRRLDATKRVCCTCMCDGWMHDDATAPRGLRTLWLPACGDPAHAVCTRCLQHEVDRALTNAIHHAMHHTIHHTKPILAVQCLFPFARTRCAAVFSLATCQQVASSRLWRLFAAAMQRRAHEEAGGCGGGSGGDEKGGGRIVLDGAAALVACPSCRTVGVVPMEAFVREGRHVCTSCRAAWCLHCDDVAASDVEVCTCTSTRAAAWSRYFFHADGWPKRRHEVTRAEYDAAVHRVATVSAEAQTSSREHYVPCPDCRQGLNKTSACNALQHCRRVVCNACGAASLPWEAAGLPLDHWRSCPRWDGDDAVARAHGYQCVDEGHSGACHTYGHECTVPAHQPGIQMQHAIRRARMLRGLQAERPPDT